MRCTGHVSCFRGSTGDNQREGANSVERLSGSDDELPDTTTRCPPLMPSLPRRSLDPPVTLHTQLLIHFHFVVDARYAETWFTGFLSVCRSRLSGCVCVTVFLVHRLTERDEIWNDDGQWYVAGFKRVWWTSARFCPPFEGSDISLVVLSGEQNWFCRIIH